MKLFSRLFIGIDVFRRLPFNNVDKMLTIDCIEYLELRHFKKCKIKSTFFKYNRITKTVQIVTIYFPFSSFQSF